MDAQRIREDAAGAWKWLADGWRNLSNRAVNALTYFSPAGGEENLADLRWGLLAVDVSEKDDHFVVELEAPGLSRDDIDVSVEGQQLLVTATKHYEKERREGAMHISERAFGSFQRSIPLPARATAEGASATYRRGVLTLKVPREMPAGARKISIQSS